MPFFPGPGTGGHCIPLDPTYLSWKAKSKNFFSKYIDLANEINQKMPNYVVQRVEKFLSNQSVNIDNCKLLVIGLTIVADSVCRNRYIKKTNNINVDVFFN